MQRNVAVQTIGAQMFTPGGADFAGEVSIYHTGDDGDQVLVGLCEHKGRGYHSYVPAQAETDFAHIAWTFVGVGAVTVTVQLYPELESAAGSGARTVLVTVDDGTDPIESAIVRFTKGAESYVGSTDVAGEVSFSLDDGTWGVAITRFGYTFTPTTLVVDGDETPTYSMTTVIIIPPDDPEAITAIYQLSDKSLADDVGVDIFFRMISPPIGSGFGYEKDWSSVQTTAGGVASIPVLPGAEYELAIASLTGCKLRTLIPIDAVNGYLIAENSTYQKV